MQEIKLVLETSTERGVVAVFDKEDCLFQEQLPFGIQNSHLLLPVLQKKMNQHSLKFKAISFVAVGLGPGSYTGIRVGAMIAKSLAFTLMIPLVGVCTLDAFIPKNEGVFAVVIDAKIGGVYLQIGCLQNGTVESMVLPQACSLSEAINLLGDVPTIVTPNAEKIRPKLEMLNPQAKWDWQQRYPEPQQLLRTAQFKLNKGIVPDDQHLELLYMRKTQAEIEKEQDKQDPKRQDRQD